MEFGINGTEVAKIYRGETVIGDFVLKDDNGDTVTSIDDAVVLITDLKNKLDPVVLELGSGVTFNAGAFRFTLSPSVTEALPAQCGIEVKITVDGIVRIAMRDIFNVYDNKVKDY